MSLRAARLTLLLVLLPIAIVAQAPVRDAAPPAGKGIIRGVVTALDTGKPIRHAAIAIQGGFGTPTLEVRSAFTDAEGRYEVTGLKAGQYSLSARKTGYLTRSYGQTGVNSGSRPVTLSDSTPLDKIDFALPLAGVIVARITDQFGDPVRGVMVRPYVQRYTTGRRQLSQASSGGSVTDDRGETRMFGLAPGDYYLAATPDFPTTWRGELDTLFPGTLDIANAQTVRVGAGQEAFATFPILRARLSSLSGRIIGSDGAPLAAPFVSLAHPMLSGGSSRRLNVAADGSFREENLAPGEWVVSVNQPEWGFARVRLLGDDVQGLLVTTRKTAQVRGRITFEGGSPPTDGIELGVLFADPPPLQSLQGGMLRSGVSVSGIRVGADTQWAFEAQISGTGVIRARVSRNWLLKAVLLDGKDVTDTMLDFGSTYADKPVEVVLTQRRGELSGTVQNDRGQTASDYTVVLFPEDEQRWTAFSRFFSTGRPDPQGRFTIGNLPPARYLAAAVESLEPGDERNPETLSRLRGAATTVELSEGESRSVTLRLTR